MFGSYMIDSDRDGVNPRLSLKCEGRMVNFYNCSVKIIDNHEVDTLFPDELDIISERWNQDKVLHLASRVPEELICDLLLDQEIFLGVGNIIKNEALFMAGIHPLSTVGYIPQERLVNLISKTREFSMLFYEVKRRDERLDAYLRIYRKRKCGTCQGKITGQKSGQRKRISFFCPKCQQSYPDSLAEAAGERAGRRI
jgi:endonuclease-8